MRLSTLLVLGMLIAAAPTIARNAGVWRDDLHEQKARVTASLHARLERETTKLAAEQMKAFDRRAANDRRRRRKQLARESARSAAALKRRTELEAQRLTVPAPVTTSDAPVATATPVTTTTAAPVITAPPVSTAPVTTGR